MIDGTGSTQAIQIILLHVVEEIHIRIPTLYFSMRIIAGKSIKEFFNEVYEETGNEASKVIESSIDAINDKSGAKPLSIPVTGKSSGSHYRYRQ